jgi:hypothetical protein
LPSDPNSQTSVGDWLDSLSKTSVDGILAQYSRVRDSVIAVNGFKMGLEKHWTELYALRPPVQTGYEIYQKQAICRIAFYTRIISVNSPLPCNPNGTVKP